MADNKLVKTTLEAAGVLLPAVKEANPYFGIVINLLIKADKALANPKANTILDVVGTQVPVVKKIDKNAATVIEIAIKGIKTANIHDSVNPDAMLQLVEAVLPIIKLMYPAVGITTEVGVGLSRTYINYSKSESMDYKTTISLISSFLPVLYNIHKTAGMTVEIFTNFAKTDSGTELLKYIPAKVYNKYILKNKGDGEGWITIFSNNSEYDKYFMDKLNEDVMVMDFYFNNVISEKTSPSENWTIASIGESKLDKDTVDHLGQDSAGE
jgi:hypothetical protein